MKFFELSNELNQKALDLLKQCRDEGFIIKNHMSELSSEDETAIRRLVKIKVNKIKKEANLKQEEEAKKSYAKSTLTVMNAKVNELLD